MDVYSDWIDACENVAQEAAGEGEEEDRAFSSYASREVRGGVTGGAGAGAGAGEDEDIDDDY